MIPVIWLVAAAGAYCGAALLLAGHLGGIGPAILTRSRATGVVVGLAAVVLHTLALHQLLFVPGGLDLGFFQVVALVGWQVAVVTLVAAWRYPVASLSVVILPVVAIATLLPIWFESSSVLSELGWRLEVHILLSLLAYSLLAVAAVQVLVVVAQERHLRDRRPGGWIRALPPLEAMESLLFRLIAAGFVLLGLALFTGLLFVDDLLAQHLVHKTVLSVVAWASFGVLLWGRWRRGWRGRVALRWTLAAFATLALAYFGSKLVLELILGTRWG
jgi:ABC-type uncharacterized transport system permease subunit